MKKTIVFLALAFTLILMPSFALAEGVILTSDITLSSTNGETGISLAGLTPSIQLTANVIPEDATDKRVSWSSLASSVATVDENGLVTAVAPGHVTIQATATDGSNVSATIEIDVYYFEGSGTAGDPYLIKTADELSYVALLTNQNNGTYRNAVYSLTNDIDASSITNWPSIGSGVGNAFMGVFNGNGHAIVGLKQNLRANTTVYGGLFGYIQNGTLKNLSLKDCDIRVATTSGMSYAGGISGYSNSTIIINCYNTGNVQAETSASGGDDYAGGIVGYLAGGSIDSCYNTGSVNIERNNSNINSYAGGIAGYANYPSTMSNCFNTGKIRAGYGGSASYAGGISGYLNDSTVEYCYNIGSATGTIVYSEVYASRSTSGGIIGQANNGKFISCYYFNRTFRGVAFGTDTTIALNAEDLLDENSFAGFDFSGKWTMSGSAEYSYPELTGMEYDGTIPESSPVFAGGNGWPTTPYRIRTTEQLNAVRDDLDACYALDNDIVFSEKDFSLGGAFFNNGLGFIPIGILAAQFNTSGDQFNGVFDGNGHSIKNLTQNISTSTNAFGGLFSMCCGLVKDLVIEDCNIRVYTSSQSNYVLSGSIASYLTNGRIEGCRTIGNTTVSSDSRNICNGGIAGRADTSLIANCINTASVVSKPALGYLGGIVGIEENSIITNCGNTGYVSGCIMIGGIAGFANVGSISGCYNRGTIENNSPAFPDHAYVGGIVANMFSGSVSTCYNAGSILAKNNSNLPIYVGGLVGSTGYGSQLSQCYNTGRISGVNLTGSDKIGGIVGSIGPGSPSTYIDCYYKNDIETGVGYGTDTTYKKNESELRNHQTYLDYNFTSVWTMDGNAAYPYPEVQANPSVCIITFDSAGGNALNPAYCGIGERITMPATPAKTGHSFAGWYQDAASTAAKQWDFEYHTVAGDITLYAKWVPNQYIVFFNTTGGSTAASQTITHNSLVSRPANPTCPGYAFVGWYKDAACSSARGR